MATINLGAIKFNWKGAYNSGTSYAVDVIDHVFPMIVYII